MVKAFAYASEPRHNYANVYSQPDSRKVNTFFRRLHCLQAKTNIRAMDLFVALRRATKQIFQF